MKPQDRDYGNLNDRLIVVEMQQKRFIAELESEKGTRARVNADLELRLRKLEAANWKAAGFVAAVVVLAQYLIPKLFP